MKRLPHWLRLTLRITLAMLTLLILTLTYAGCSIIAQPGHSYTGPLPSLTPEERLTRDNLRNHVTTLATGIRDHNHPDNYTAAQTYISKNFQDQGYQSTASNPMPLDPTHTIANILAELPGTTKPSEILLIGAHYDSVPTGPGANDNGSGVAATLELARLFANSRQPRTLRFIAFYNEESVSPWGARLYAQDCRDKNENIIAMICLETIGCYTDAPNSQHYPAPFSLFYPSTGNFIAFVGSIDYKPILHDSIYAFRVHTNFPSRGVAAPGFLKDDTRSDHAAFWTAGYPAVMVTDTANFRYADYHQPTDTPEKIDFDRTARVTVGLKHVVHDLANK